MFHCALTIFSVLVGLGSWLISSPAPHWVGSKTVWIMMNLVIGIGVIPIWYKLGFSTKNNV